METNEEQIKTNGDECRRMDERMEEQMEMKRDLEETELLEELTTKKLKVRTTKKLEKGRVFEGGGIIMVR